MPSRTYGIVSMSVLVEADLRHAMRMALARDGLTFTEWVTAAMRSYLQSFDIKVPRKDTR